MLELDLGSFFNVKVYLFNIFLNLKPIFYNIWVSEVISQHLLINLDLGPTLKCAPGHDSIEDSSIIKSYWLKSGVADSENFKMWIWAISEWGSFDSRTPCLDHVWELKVPGIFYSGAAENHDFVVRGGLGPLKVWFDLARELKYPGNFNSHTWSKHGVRE